MKSLARWFPRPVDRLFILGGPALFWLLVFFAVPLALMAVISFAQRGPYGVILYRWAWGDYAASVAGASARDAAASLKSPQVVGYLHYVFQNYARALDPLYLTIYVRSIVLALVTTLLCLFLACPLAYYMAVKCPARWRSLLVTLVVIPFWTSFLVRTYAWILILRADGIINSGLVEIQHFLIWANLPAVASFVNPPYRLLYNDFAVLVGLVYGELPFMILPLYTSLQKLDTTLLEASADLGARPWTGFLRITLPLTRPGMMAGIIFVFVPSIGAFVIPDLMGGSKSIMIGNLIQNQFTVVRDLPFGAAVSFLLTFFVLGMLYLRSQLVTNGEDVH